MESRRATKRSKVINNYVNKAKSGVSKAVLKVGATDDPAPLTAAQAREVRRRIKDVDDRARYLLVSKFTPSFLLYYNVAKDTYAMNEPSSATLFKRRAADTAALITRLYPKLIRKAKAAKPPAMFCITLAGTISQIKL